MTLTTYASNTLTSGAAGVKGSYTQIVASTPYASSRLHLVVSSASAQQLFFLVDLATGGAGAETVVVADVAVAAATSVTVVGSSVALDVDLPAGTRLSARCQSVSGTVTISISVLLEDRALAGLAAPVTYGTVTGVSGGTSVDPGGTASTKGSYVQLSASTTARMDAVALCFTIVAQAQPIAAFQVWLVDLATGGAGAETVVISDLRLETSSVTDVVQPGLVRLPVAIPAGTRLAVRCLCTVNTATQRILKVTAIGMQEPATGGGAAGAVAYVG